MEKQEDDKVLGHDPNIPPVPTTDVQSEEKDSSTKGASIPVLDEKKIDEEMKKKMPSHYFRRCNVSRAHNEIFGHALAFPPEFGSERHHYSVNIIADYWVDHPLPSNSLISFGEKVASVLMDSTIVVPFSEAEVVQELNAKVDNYGKVYFTEYATVPICWQMVFLMSRHSSFILHNDFDSVPIKAYMQITDLLATTMPCERKLLISVLEYKCNGPLPYLASQANVKNIQFVMSRLKLMNAVPLIHQIFRAPTVKSKILGIIRLLELYGGFWGELPWSGIEKLAEFLFIAFNWIMEKTRVAKECADLGYEWVKAKFEDVQEYFAKPGVDESKDIAVDLPINAQMQAGSVATDNASDITHNPTVSCYKCSDPNIVTGCSLCGIHLCAEHDTKSKSKCGCRDASNNPFRHTAENCQCANNNDCFFRAVEQATGFKTIVIKRKFYNWLCGKNSPDAYAAFCENFPEYKVISTGWEDFRNNCIEQIKIHNMAEIEMSLMLVLVYAHSVYVTVVDEENEVLKGIYIPECRYVMHLKHEYYHYSWNEFPVTQKPEEFIWGGPFRGWDSDEFPVPVSPKRVHTENVLTKNETMSGVPNHVKPVFIPNVPAEKVAEWLNTMEDTETSSVLTSDSNSSESFAEQLKRVEAKFTALRTKLSDESSSESAAPRSEQTEEVVQVVAAEEKDKEEKQTFWEYLKSIKLSEVGSIVADWFKNATKEVITFFQENKLLTGIMSMVIGIASFLGISIVSLSTPSAASAFLSRFTNATRSMYYAERGMSGLMSTFSKTMDAAKEILGISSNPVLDEFKVEVNQNLVLANEMLAMATNNCGEFVNNSAKFLEFKKNIELIRKSYEKLAKMHNDKDLAVITPIWHSLNRVFEKLQLTYSKVMASSTSRQEPVVIYIHGKTAIGKSHLATHLINEINKARNSEMKTFTISNGPEYWNGFCQQEVIRIDDMNAVIGPEGDKDSAVIFDLATSAPYNPNQASLEDKAIMANPKYLVVCSNHLTIPTNSIVTEREAWERRRHIMIHVEWPEHEKCPRNTTDCIHLRRLAEFEKKHGHKDFSHLRLTQISPMVSTDLSGDDLLNKRMNKNFKPHFPGPEDARLEELMEEGLQVSIQDVVKMAVVKEREFYEVFQRSMKDAINAGSMQTASWKLPPHVFILGPPGTGKSHILKWYVESVPKEIPVLELKTLDKFEKWAEDGFTCKKKSVVVINDLSLFVNSERFKAFWMKVHERYDLDSPDVDLWIAAGNEEVLIDAILEKVGSSMEQVELFFRRATIFRTSYKNKVCASTAKVRQLFKLKPKVYSHEDVSENPEKIDDYVQYEQNGTPLTQQSCLNRLLVYMPQTVECEARLTLPVRNAVPMTSVLKIDISADDFIEYINNTHVSKILTLITTGKCQTFSKTLSPQKIGKLIFNATKKAKNSLGGSYFDSLDSLLLQIWQKKLLEDLKGECLVLATSDKMYYADYTTEKLECGILQKDQKVVQLLDALKEHVHIVSASDVFKSGHSILPHWLVLAGEIVSVALAISGTTLAAVESVREQEEMYKSSAYIKKLAAIVETGTQQMKDTFLTKVETGFSRMSSPSVLKPGIQFPKMPQYGDLEQDNFYQDVVSPYAETTDDESPGDKRDSHGGKYNKLRPEHTGAESPPDGAEKGKQKYNAMRPEANILQTLKEYVHDTYNQLHAKTKPALEGPLKFQCCAKEVAHPTKEVEPVREVLKDPETFTIVNKILKNCVEIYSKSGDRLCSGLLVRGRCVRTVAHLLATYKVKDLKVRTVCGRFWNVEEIYKNDVVDRLDLRISDPTFQMSADVTSHFPATSYNIPEGTHAILVTPEFGLLKETVTVVIRPVVVNNLKLRHFVDSPHGLNTIEYRGHRAGYVMTSVNTKYGDCGSLLIVTDSTIQTGKVIGMHVAATTEKAYASPMRNEQYLDKIQFQVSADHFLSKKWFVKVSDPEDPTLVAKTTVANHIPAKTKLFENWIKIGPKAYEPSILSSDDPRGDGTSLLRRESMKWCKPREGLISSVKNDLMECMEEIAYHYVDIFRSEGIVLSKLTSTEALNKIRTSPASEPINTSTSAGFPWNKMTQKPGKTAFIKIAPSGERRFSNSPDDQKLVGHLRSAIDHLCTRKKCDVVFQAYLKDELVKLSKIYETPKTRTIATAPLHFTIAYRKYFHAAHSAIMQCWHLVAPKVGINPMSLDWHMLFTSMQEVSTYGLDLDFKGWDFSHDPFFVIIIARFYEILYQELDLKVTEDDQATRKYLYSKILGFKLLIGNHLHVSTGGIPSGYPGTTIDNSMVNFLIHYYVWKKIMRRANSRLANLTSFYEDIRIATYGDDVLMAISQYASKYYNGPVLQREFALLGFEAQSSEKGKDIMAIRPLQDCTFLSRRFKLFGSVWLGPLKRDNLNKPTWYSSDRRSHYFWMSPTEKIKAVDIVQNVYESLLYNAALDSRAVYNEFRPAACEINRIVNLPPPLSYEDCLYRMLGFAKPSEVCPGLKMIQVEDILEMDWNHAMPPNFKKAHNRTYYNFGPEYHFTGSAPSNPMPKNITRILTWVNGLLKREYNSVLVNIYPPGGSIPWHKDSEKGLDMHQGVFGVTLKGDGKISFKSVHQKFQYYLEPGLGYLMEYENLTQFSHMRDEHSIPTVTFTFRKLDTSD